MASDTGDRQSEGVTDTSGAEKPRVKDIFDTIAEKVFTNRGLDVEQSWCDVIAEEFRIAMKELHVEVKPDGPPPDPKRTKNGTLMLLFGALENGDLWIQDTEVPMSKQPDGTMTLAGSIIRFVCGSMDVEVQFIYSTVERVLTFERILAVYMENGTRLTTDHHDRRWLANYKPTIDLDVFSPALQRALMNVPDGKQWTVVGHDHLGRSYRWLDGRSPTLWRDARGREL